MRIGLVEKILLILMVIVLTLGFTSLASANLGTFAKDSCVEIRTILNTTTTTISSLGYPNNTVVYLNKVMTKNGNTFNYTFCDTSVLGRYVYDYNDTQGYTYVNDFYITYNGEKVSSSNTVIAIVFLIIAALMFGLGFSFSSEHWILKTFFNFSAVLFGILSINTARIIANESSNLGAMSTSGLVVMIVVASLFLVYIFIHYFIETIRLLKEKRELRWEF